MHLRAIVLRMKLVQRIYPKKDSFIDDAEAREIHIREPKTIC
jgi:hypothetical protein